MKESKRLGWIDYAKGIAILLVVCRHVISGIERAGLSIDPLLYTIQNISYNIRMPLFFIIAGLFIQKSIAKRNIQEFFIYKSNTILYPYFIWVTLQLSLAIIFSNHTNYERDINWYLYILYYPQKLDQFWFLYTLFNVSIIFSLFSYFKINNAKFHVIIGLIFYYSSSVISDIYAINNLLTDTLHYYLFFSIGNLLSNFILDKSNRHMFSSLKFLLLLLPFFIFSQYYWLENLDLKESNPLIFAIIALIGTTFMICISFILEKTNYIKVLKLWGTHSLYIYIMHVIIIAGYRIILQQLNINNVYFLLVTSVLLGLFLPIISYKFLMKYNFWFLFNFQKVKVREESKQSLSFKLNDKLIKQ